MTAVKCACCEDQIPEDAKPFTEPSVGEVCPECRHRLMVARVWMKHFKMEEAPEIEHLESRCLV